MAITTTDSRTTEVTHAHVGRVVELREFLATRNMSDTLDYTDFRTVTVKEALVYLGRYGNPTGSPYQPIRDLAVNERFTWVDVSNHFAWRGEGVRTAEVDFDPSQESAQDLIDFKESVLAAQRAKEEKEAAYAASAKENARLKELNRPMRGKMMIVVSGRKVKPGTTGMVAAFSNDMSSCLLKSVGNWHDRKANGVWVQAHHLAAHVPCADPTHDDCRKSEEMAKACALEFFYDQASKKSFKVIHLT